LKKNQKIGDFLDLYSLKNFYKFIKIFIFFNLNFFFFIKFLNYYYVFYKKIIMEILPLNYNNILKIIFYTEIAKKFLENFLDIKIAKIKLLEKYINLTNKAREIRFDFRCKGDKHFIEKHKNII